MSIYLVVVFTLLFHTSFKGSKVLISLFALELGANPLEVGVLFSMYSMFPVFLSIYAGRVSDRFGFRPPMVFGACGLVAGLMLPFMVPTLGMLYVSALLIGMCYIFYIVTVQSLVGAIGGADDRTRNYSIFSLGVALTSLIGPTTAGFAIDLIGHRYTYLLLAVVPIIPIVVLVMSPRLFPHQKPKHQEKQDHHWTDLARDRPLRRALITAGVIETGLELFNFFMPIYGRSIGLSASKIGVCLGSFAAALLLVRLAMPYLARRMSEEGLLSASLFLAAGTCLLFPFVSEFALLLVIAFILGLGLGAGSPLSMILAYNRAPPARAGEAMGLRQMVNKTTEMAMPLIFGSLGTALGMIPVFWLDAALLAWGAALMRKDVKSRRAPQAATPSPAAERPGR